MQRTFLFEDTAEIFRLRHCYSTFSNNNRKNELPFYKSTIDHLLSELERQRQHSNDLAGRGRKLERELELKTQNMDLLVAENNELKRENNQMKTMLQQRQSLSQNFRQRTPKKRKSQFPNVDEEDADDAEHSSPVDAPALRRSFSMPPPDTPLGIVGTTSALSTRAVTATRPPVAIIANGGIKRRRANNTSAVLVKSSRISQSQGDLAGGGIYEEIDEVLPSVCESPWLFADQIVHSFQKKRNLIKHQCARCQKTVGFNVLYVKCTRCKENFHESCRLFAPLPCVIRQSALPKVVLGNANNKTGRPRLGDFCPDNRPMVPPLIIFCTYFLDRCKAYVPYKDLYQVSGNSAEVETVTKQFLHSNKGYPKLDIFSPDIVAACVNKFLSQIREPLIPYSYGKEICALSDSLAIDGAAPEEADKAKEGFAGIVEDLPLAHMDTLGHLCRHWNRLISNSFGLLDIDKLSVPLGPLVFGSVRPDCPLVSEQCAKAMAHLLRLGSDFWTDASVRTLRIGTPNSISRNPSQRSARSVVAGGGTTTPPPPTFGTSSAAAFGHGKGGGCPMDVPPQHQREVDLNATSGDTSNYESARNSHQRQ